MYIETFKVFCDLAETGSFSKAASLNSITQSAVSQQIRTLETRYKVSLVERGRRSLELTPEGVIFLAAGKEILNIYNHLGDRLHELRDVVAGELRVASIYSIGLHELPPVSVYIGGVMILYGIIHMFRQDSAPFKEGEEPLSD